MRYFEDQPHIFRRSGNISQRTKRHLKARANRLHYFHDDSFFLGLEAQRLTQKKEDLLLIEECKSTLPRFHKILEALKKGAQWNRGRDLDDSRLAIHCSALHCTTSYIWDLMMNAGADFFARDADGNTFIHIAAEENNVEALHWWFSKSFSITDLNTAGLTPFEMALQSGAFEFLELLHTNTPLSDADLTAILYKLPQTLVGFSYDPFAYQVAEYLFKLGAQAQPHHTLSKTIEHQGFPQGAALVRMKELIAISKTEQAVLTASISHLALHKPTKRTL